ncbi:MAG: hypothetical protein GY832_01495 [Chloroflexi bacterium]|nr:hypothetical protein [Chloroflexota bacterium]
MRDRKPFEFARVAGILAVLIALVALTATPAMATLSDCHDASCRVRASDGSTGSGCAFANSNGMVYVLTNAHVATTPTISLEFWRGGHKSSQLSGRVIAKDTKADAAIVAIAETSFGGVLPDVIPLGGSGDSPRPGGSIMSVGCAGGSWSTGWKGHVLGYSGADMYFQPPPANGRSGSAIFDAEGTKIVGLLYARKQDDSAGIATSLPALHRAFAGRNTKLETSILKEAAKTRVQCPGGNCPAPGSGQKSPWRLSPYRHNQDQRIGGLQQQQQVWPTMPGVAAPAAPSINLDSTNLKLDRIAELLIEMRADQRAEQRAPPAPASPPLPMAPLVPITPATPSEVDDTAIREAEAKSAAAIAEVKAESAEAVSDMKVRMDEAKSQLKEVADKLIGDRETLRERFDERIAKVKEELGEDASRREIAAAYAKDLAQEKLADGSVGMSVGKIAAGALGVSGPMALAIGFGAWFLSRRVAGKVEAGEPLLVQRLIERVGDKIDSLKDRVASGPGPAPPPTPPPATVIVTPAAPVVAAAPAAVPTPEATPPVAPTV